MEFGFSVFQFFQLFGFSPFRRSLELKNWKTEFHKRRMDPRLLLWNSVFQFFSFPTVGASNLIGTKSVPKYIKFTVNTSKIEVCIGFFWGGYHICYPPPRTYVSEAATLLEGILPCCNDLSKEDGRCCWFINNFPYICIYIYMYIYI